MSRVVNAEPRPFRAVVFDLDGTLIDSYSAIHECLNRVLAHYGRPLVSLEECRRMVGHGLEILIEQAVGKENVAEGVRLFRERYRVAGPLGTKLLDGADEVTAALVSRRLKLAVASNKPSYFSRQLLTGLGIADRFEAVVGPDSGFPPKPDPAMVRHLLAQLGVPKEEVLFVGDMPIDVETARAVGLKVAVLPTGSSPREELEATGADFLLGALEEVLSLLPAV